MVQTIFSRSKKSSGYSETRYLVANAPLAIFASALPGAVNYLIIIYLSHSVSLEATGSYRVLISLLSLVGLASMAETNKIFVRAIVNGDSQTPANLLINRLSFASAFFAAVLLAWLAGRLFHIWAIPETILWIAALAAIIYPLDSYHAAMQARQSFAMLALAEAVKYSVGLGLFIFMIEAGHSVEQAMLAQFCAIAGFHILYFSIAFRSLQISSIFSAGFRKALTSRASRQARIYSYANLLPAALEHIDKLLVGLVFGLEILGIYTLAYSTGRLVYNMIKPTLYIYYSRFVTMLPQWRILRDIALVLTLLGVLMAIAFWIAVNNINALHKFQTGAPVTMILFIGYGVGLVRAVYGQAFAINSETNPLHAWKAAWQASGFSIILLALALLAPANIALILLALQYPLRDGLTVGFMAHYRRQNR